MPDEPKPLSERARKRAAGKILREVSIKRRETYFDSARVRFQRRADCEP